MALTQTALMALFLQCAPQVAPETLSTLIAVESSGNPFAIAVVGNKPIPPPKSAADAIATIKKLDAGGENFSVGLMQINKKNFQDVGLTLDNAFEPCANIAAGAKIFEQCFITAKKNTRFKSDQSALRGALSCYYSGNLSRGFQKEDLTGNSYVERANNKVAKQYRVPPILPEEKKAGSESSSDFVVIQDELNSDLKFIEKPIVTKQPWDVYGDY